MTGLVARTGRSVRLVRTAIEATVLTVGWLLGGTDGIGTLVLRPGHRSAGAADLKVLRAGCCSTTSARRSTVGGAARAARPTTTMSECRQTSPSQTPIC
jgi:hypothetical protein